MGNTLSYFGTDPQMLGLATIGGLLSLAYLVWKLVTFVYRQRSFFSASLLSYRRKRLLRDIRRYKLAVRHKNLGKSDIVIARQDLRYGLMGVGSAIGDAAIAGLNLVSYRFISPAKINLVGAVLMLLLLFSDGMRVRGSVRRAWQMIDWANYPENGKAELIERFRRLRGARPS
jgi:hypothetical protein